MNRCTGSYIVQNGVSDGVLRPLYRAVSRFSDKNTIYSTKLSQIGGIQMSDKKYFVLMENGKDTSQVFASKQPRGAALKAATRGHTNIRLRERGTKRVHVFTGSITMVDKPANGPAWLPDKIKKANVKKSGIEHL